MLRSASTKLHLSPTGGTMKYRSVWTVSAAAIAVLTSGNVHAFQMHPPSYTTGSRYQSQILKHSYYHTSSTKLLAQSNGDGVLDKVKNVVKSFLPTKWFQSKEEKQAAIEVKGRKQEIKGGLTEMLKDAPLPVRMLGGLAGSLMSSALSSMAETFQEQQQVVEILMAQAERCILADDTVVSALGEPVQVSKQPFSQSSSMSSINGKTQTNVQLAFSVQGRLQSGVAQLTSDGSSIGKLAVQVGSRVMEVSTTPRKSSFSQQKSDDDNNIIEAEIIEKKTRK
jgi:hypothetical protein